LAVLAACPSCAVLLDPKPTASGRCRACRERIIVKRIEGGVLYLTASAAERLEAAQRSRKETMRQARARDRWLALATAVGAPTPKIEKLGQTIATAAIAAGARDLYVAAAHRAVVAAVRERRFADATTMRRAQVAALYRDLGSPGILPDDLIELARDAERSELKGLRASGREAELVAAGCCDECAVEAGLVVRIADELKAPRLPRAGCTRGLCRCRWVAARVAGVRPTRAGAGPRR
jgi:hypothetical protein